MSALRLYVIAAIVVTTAAVIADRRVARDLAADLLFVLLVLGLIAFVRALAATPRARHGRGRA